jgi:hypothetical protein
MAYADNFVRCRWEVQLLAIFFLPEEENKHEVPDDLKSHPGKQKDDFYVV